MEQSIMSLFTTSFLVFSIGIAISVIIIRRIVEAIFRKSKAILPDKIEDIINDIWKQWILRGLPIVVGVLIALFAKEYPFPEEFAGSNSGRIFLGLIAGLFSNTIYSIAKFHVKKHLPKSVKDRISNINPLQKKEEE